MKKSGVANTAKEKNQKSLKGMAHILYQNPRKGEALLFIESAFKKTETNFKKENRLPDRHDMLEILKCLNILSSSNQKNIQAKFPQWHSIIKELIPGITDPNIRDDIKKSKLFPDLFSPSSISKNKK